MTTNDPPETARKHFNEFRLDELESKILQLQIDALKKASEDHESRLRALEDTATKFNFLLYLTMGGGLVGLFNLLGLAYLILAGGR
jgi:hypothetical protein